MNSIPLRTSSEPVTERVLEIDWRAIGGGFSSQDVELMLRVPGQEVQCGVVVGGEFPSLCGWDIPISASGMVRSQHGTCWGKEPGALAVLSMSVPGLCPLWDKH